MDGGNGEDHVRVVWWVERPTKDTETGGPCGRSSLLHASSLDGHHPQLAEPSTLPWLWGRGANFHPLKAIGLKA